ncbi:hypothetical protein EDB87DRAFT_1620387 [Lactarius vividus]|nr:hypothetical protein EDB87DRAFT_1620387 [Lactarius vividus]
MLPWTFLLILLTTLANRYSLALAKCYLPYQGNLPFAACCLKSMSFHRPPLVLLFYRSCNAIPLHISATFLPTVHNACPP